MKKNTSIRIFKLTFIPPFAVLAAYFSVGLLFEGYAAIFMSTSEAKLIESIYISHAKSFQTNNILELCFIYYAYIFILFSMLAINVSFYWSFVYLKTSLFHIVPNESFVDFVRNHKFLFWDECVEEILEKN